MKKNGLTKCEREIMELLWKVDRPLTAAEIIALSPDRSWKNSYIHLLLNSLLEKNMIRTDGFIKTAKNYARTFVAAYSSEEYAVRQITARSDLSPAAIVSIVSALVDESPNRAAMILALQKMLEEKMG